MDASCFDHDERLLGVDEAAAALRKLFPSPMATERLPLASLLGRVLATDIRSPIDVPQNTNAALDGVALAWSGPERLRFDIVGESMAGRRHPPRSSLRCVGDTATTGRAGARSHRCTSR